MPTTAPTLSWSYIRNYTEKFSWRDPRTNLITEGYNPPSTVPQKDIQHVPFSIKFITGEGNVEQGYCICLKVNRRKHMRLVQFVESQEIRWVRDYLVMEINGTHFVTRTLNDFL